MATLSVNFFRASETSSKNVVVKSLYLVGKRLKSLEKICGFEYAFSCLATKMQNQCWVIKRDGVWSVQTNNKNLEINYDYIEVTIK